MFTTLRQSEILRLVRDERTCTITDLAARFEVSDETIRRTIKPLIADGLLIKVHGGVMLPERLDEPPFPRRMGTSLEGKRAMAAHIAGRVRDGESLIIEGGTTCLRIAEALAARSRLTVVTHSIEVARVLNARNGNRVFIAGGELRADDSAAFGDSVLAFLRQFRVRHAIVSVTAIDLQGRFMDALPADVAFAQAAFAQAERRIVAADRAKIGHSALLHVFEPDGVDLLVTDEAPPPALAQVLAAAGVEIEVAAAAAL
ncbi:DeoR/GlpR family DNA-binding transcription regulator [Paraburkholderia sp. D15]|uniref:DeoR/GlpR family DNA-binding transcription regulator n=1 Tax=Paraburkholderia sp. D15 TaxID=2880218 RepID=UPI00247903D0|nr:DeoR/GlpR family DNA-binding transcription regulator [Paraburkholderia sp. D15]WGS53415.1 DeoR/GlpR family DNA-binding transcription regulator [Paraburkholderia sp. D15]WKF61133.1 Glycerol-3-phosphate regulon repressor [Paraburkholderia busanensis]